MHAAEVQSSPIMSPGHGIRPADMSIAKTLYSPVDVTCQLQVPHATGIHSAKIEPGVYWGRYAAYSK